MVYRIAHECYLTGDVRNDAEGILIRIFGCVDNIDNFTRRIQQELPPLAKIDAIESRVVIDKQVVAGTQIVESTIVNHCMVKNTRFVKDSDLAQDTSADDFWNYHDFTIVDSIQGIGQTEVTADAATCTACWNEVLDPKEKRYLYPFTNCTHCGPRLSIIRGIPYDRPNTTMTDFPLCSNCLNEYADPADRRFHAQPIACHQCGPQLSLYICRDNNNMPLQKPLHFNVNTASVNTKGIDSTHDILSQINKALHQGKIIAIKGIGGFHLCCDATNFDAVKRLRQRKQRYANPFALMWRDLGLVEQYCQLNNLEEQTISSSAAPIVLLKRHATLHRHIPQLADDVAPGSHLLGVMLPYTPLHNLIVNTVDFPLVMTSGNLSGEPQIIHNQEALDKLYAIADLVVTHNRDIANRMDDSVVTCVTGQVRVLRRARGYAPRSIKLPRGFEQAENILAYGAELKSTFCLLKNGSAILSQHQGDLEDVCTFDDYEKNIDLYKTLFECDPHILAYDKHPEYLSSKLARSLLDSPYVSITNVDSIHRQGVDVQHHHAHIASAMVENDIALDHGPVLGIALDGLGFGDDGNLWGGEILLVKYDDYERLACFTPVAMPGGKQAVKQPWRNSVAHILNAMSWEDFMSRYGQSDFAAQLDITSIQHIQQMLQNKLNCPLASSVGRLFDAVAGVLNLSTQQIQFEGQAAIALEMLIDFDALYFDDIEGYPFTIEGVNNEQPFIEDELSCHPLYINARSIWEPLLNDVINHVDKSVISLRFHVGLINGLATLIDHLAVRYDFNDVVLSGGCMQNTVLLEGLEREIKRRKLRCLTHSAVPANDGGIALGQVAVAAAKIIKMHEDI